MVTVDDVQWADEPTGALIRALLPQLGRLPVVLVLTVRSTPADIPDRVAAVLADAARNDPLRLRLSGRVHAAIARTAGVGPPRAIAGPAGQLYELAVDAAAWPTCR